MWEGKTKGWKKSFKRTLINTKAEETQWTALKLNLKSFEI